MTNLVVLSGSEYFFNPNLEEFSSNIIISLLLVGFLFNSDEKDNMVIYLMVCKYHGNIFLNGNIICLCEIEMGNVDVSWESLNKLWFRI